MGDGEIAATLEGEWEVDGDGLTLTGHIAELSIDGQPLDEFFVKFFTFAIDGEELTLCDEDEGETVWDRVPLESAVKTQSWGQIKQLSH